MNKYFMSDEVRRDYFSETITSSVPLKPTGDSLKLQPPIEPRSVLEKVVTNYGVKRSGVVVRRYGIK